MDIDKLKANLEEENRRIKLERLEEERPIIEAMSRAMHDYQRLLWRRYIADGLTHQEAFERVRDETSGK